MATMADKTKTPSTRERRPRPRFVAGEKRIVKVILESALESGIGSTDAVRLAIGVYKEIDVIARDEKCNILSPSALKDIRMYCRAILRSGTTFSAFEIAQRGVIAWREMARELVRLHDEWDRESVTERLKERKRRIELAERLKGQRTVAAAEVEGESVNGNVNGNGNPSSLYTRDGFREMADLDRESRRRGVESEGTGDGDDCDEGNP